MGAAMVRFRPTILVSDVFGSAGDITARHVEGETFLVKRSSIRFPGSPAQLEHLEVHRRALAAWREVPHSVQEVWNEYACEVEPHRPPFDHSSWISGQDLFVSAYHGFHTLGREHRPEPVRFEPFPGFAFSDVSAVVSGEDLVLRLSVAGLEYVDASRFWVYDRVQLVVAGRGLSSRVPWRSVLASGPCSTSPVEVVLSEFRSVWPAVDGTSVLGVNMRFVLLDAVTGYRSQKHRKSFVVEL